MLFSSISVPDAPIAVEEKIALRVMLGVGDEHEVREVVVGERGTGFGQWPVAEDVTVDDEKGFIAKKRQRMLDTAGGFQGADGFGRVGDGEPELAAISKGFLDHCSEVGVVDHDMGEAFGLEPFKMPDDERFSSCAKERLGAAIGEGAEALATACGEDHSYHGRAARYGGC